MEKTSSHYALNDKRVGTAQMKRHKASVGRPQTAAIVVGSFDQRPQTGAVPKAQTMFGHNSLAALGQNDRAASALIPNAQMNIARYEEIIGRMKKNLEREKQSIRHVKTQIAREIKVKTELEKILRQCVDDVKGEIGKKKTDNKSVYCKLHLI